MSGEPYSEKVSVNINTSTLSQIDILVDHGFYSNRSDFINQALREKLQAQRSTVERLIEAEEAAEPEQNKWFLGIVHMSREELERVKAAGRTIRLKGYGLLTIPDSIPDELVLETVESISVRGKVICSDAVRVKYGIK